ncbi:DUF4238 domain-containing protein [Myroides sp. 1354]|uniref:DUF4238 domain-containing protein n=1 Tax=unclassified Myroides TaxID=2642485 RepID=UPI0025762490|nr:MULTISPECIES: DUF4238 domain-containing protein [unclassified Myroides]MDM1044331.1 DUF4238 domain-containing protein [Myroides sp. R163-1]MDM1056205.1 DUF4238 domain-containing protein [Myroides sp. 1354]MDM1069439.1 DUF4238 domain-containing protein [Myroides sp. 1372]
MAHPKNQHYVPKLLLKNFSSKDSFIWTYDKLAKTNNWNFIKERPINRVASENYFYDQIQKDENFSFEYELGKIEREISPLIEKLVLNQKINSITELEKEKISYFIAIQLIRTKWQLNRVKDHVTEFEEIINQFTGMQQESIDHKTLWFSLFEAATKFSTTIQNKVWLLGKSDRLFFISDNPVVLQNTINQSTVRSTIGFDSYGIEIYMPLSDSLILCMFCEKLLQNKHEIPNLLNFDYENVLNINALQFYQSERFLFSSSNNFEMIKESIDI